MAFEPSNLLAVLSTLNTSVVDLFHFDTDPDPWIRFVEKPKICLIPTSLHIFFILFFYSAKFSEKFACTYNNNTALIKQM